MSPFDDGWLLGENPLNYRSFEDAAIFEVIFGVDKPVDPTDAFDVLAFVLTPLSVFERECSDDYARAAMRAGMSDAFREAVDTWEQAMMSVRENAREAAMN